MHFYLPTLPLIFRQNNDDKEIVNAMATKFSENFGLDKFEKNKKMPHTVCNHRKCNHFVILSETIFSVFQMIHDIEN